MEVDEQSSTEAATSKVTQLQAMIESTEKLLDPESSCLKELRKELEAARKQTGATAQSKALKDLHAAAHQLNLHRDIVLKGQEATCKSHDETLATLEKAVADHKALMHKQKELDKEVTEYIETLQAQTAALIKHASDMPAQGGQSMQEPQAPPVTTPAPEVATLTDALRTVLSQVTATTLPEDTSEQKTALEQLRTTITSTLQPILGAGQTGGNAYGPAATQGHAVRQESAPYLEVKTGTGAAAKTGQ